MVNFRIRARFMVILCCATLSGCGGALVTYPGSPKSEDSIATVERGVFKVPGREYITFFEGYAKWHPESRLNFTQTSGMPSELKMLPGEYVLSIRCATGNQYAISSTHIKVEAGATYQVLCGPVPDQLDKIFTFTKKVAPDH